MKEPLIYVNGNFYRKSKAMVSVFDHGLLYGDGIFETLRAYDGKILFLSRHLNRLFSSASLISLTLDLSLSQVRGILYETLEQNQLKNAYMRISLTRGEGEIGLNPGLCSNPTLIVMAKPFSGHPEELYQSGIQASLVHIRRNAPQATDPSIKSLNYLNNILAMHEALRIGAREAFMLNLEGWVCEGSVSNVFWVRNGILKTPATECGLLAGVTREAVITLARQAGIPVSEGYFLPEDLLSAEEAFITNTTFEVMPVTSLDQKVISHGKVGRITRFLWQEYRKKIPQFLTEE
jgi:branched-chain amino acid aminotransferase